MITSMLPSRLNPLLSYLLLIIITTGMCYPLSAKSDERPNMPEHSISITFDIKQKLLTGTSRITLPPNTPLILNFGPLEITGAVLEHQTKPQQSLFPNKDNIIRLRESNDKQTLYASWKLLTSNPYATGNLISESGITLAGFWHPVPDIDMHYTLEAELPDNFTGIAEGETVTYCKDKFNKRYLNTAFNHPIRSINFAAGPYTVKSRNLDNNIELFAFFFDEDIELADEYLDKAASYINQYEKLIGPFPYSRYSIVENRLPTGYGMPTYTLLGQAVVRLPFIKDTSLGHEILHSWFGNSVFGSDSGGNWTEGLTTYLADHLYAEKQGKGIEYRKNQLLRYISYVKHDNKMALQDFVNASDSQPMARKVRAIGYDKGSMLFHMLRVKLGDDAFFKAISIFYQDMKFKRAAWEDIQNIFSQTTGTDLSIFFKQWLTRPDLPMMVFGNISVKQLEGQSRISFKVEQKTEEPYQLQLPLQIKTRTGVIEKTIELKEKQTDIELTVNELPVELLIDPDYDIIRPLNTNEQAPVWSLFMGAEYKLAILGSEEERPIYDSLIKYLQNIDCETVLAEEVDNADLKDGSFIFLGTSLHSKGLFADTNHTEPGFSLDIRKNPLNEQEVMVLVTSSDALETEPAARKLRHYGKYSFLFFQKGQLKDKRIAFSRNGLSFEIFAEPQGVRVPDIQTFEGIINEVQDSKVVYVGEMHTDMGNHILQLQVIQALFQKDPDLAIGMEMFPTTSQQALDEYINGTITTEKEFLKKSNYFKVWGFDYRLYREIINFARLNKIPLIALNIDKKIVSAVFREGHLDSLDKEQFQMIPIERDLDVPGYSQRLSEAFASHDQRTFSPEKMGGFIQAQSIWDETMADNIVKYLTAHPEKKMVVIAGNGHVYKDSAIPLRVKRRSDIPQKVIASISHETNGAQKGYAIDYLLFNRSFEIQPAPKVGIVLLEEKTEGSKVPKVRIVRVSPHSKAKQADIKKDDIILAIDGEPIEEIVDIRVALLDKKSGDKVTIKLLRENKLFGDKVFEEEVELSSQSDLQGKMPPGHPK